uniref:Sulfatase-modifying factor enzyme 1 n=1 Tax=Candidatus Kentrum sp. DK TaxID=2126562 RepID=A0A450SW70_9GAMM|nr:MAG: Sulfatase-modifying factor enzyme 1 [Candidatus Kentron sp. DK]
MRSTTPQKRLLRFYKNLGRIQKLAIVERVGAIYRLLHIPPPSASLPCPLDPKYILPGSQGLALCEDWKQQKFLLGFLLLETVIGRAIEHVDDVDFNGDGGIHFEMPRETGDDLNAILADLLDPDKPAIANMEQLALRLRALLFRFIPLEGCENIRFSSIVTKEDFDVFLQAEPEWRQGHQPPGSSYLRGYESFAAHEPVFGINGKAAKAYCDWLSGQYGLMARYTDPPANNRTPGFRLPTPEEHQAFVRSGSCADTKEGVTELVADGEGIKTFHQRSGTYRIHGEDLATTTSVFRFCIEREQT